MTRSAQFALEALTLATSVFGATGWQLWDRFAERFIDNQGRVIDFHSDQRTTSEGQAYAGFFALAANDRSRFNALLQWTQDNLAAGDLRRHLPAWNWGRNARGEWGVLDSNAAADADLWLAYTLFQAGIHWGESQYRDLGEALARQIVSREVKVLPGFGPMLQPAPKGFRPDRSTFQLNPSYVPLQVVLGLAEAHPKGPWKDIARGVAPLLRGSAPNGFALDWIAYHASRGFRQRPNPAGEPLGGFDAIRVYLWAGMLDPSTPTRAEVFDALRGMDTYLSTHAEPPGVVSGEGVVKDSNAGPGFTAALVPFAKSAGRHDVAEALMRQLASYYDPATGLYGQNPRYYDQCLALFSTGWTERRFYFDHNGNLFLKWRQP